MRRRSPEALARRAAAALGAFAVVLGGACRATADPPGWRNIGPGGGGWIPCVAVSPQDSRVIYAGCDVGGFYRSTDGGASWRILNSGLRDYYVEVIVPHPRDERTIYLGTEGGVYRTRDAGESWEWLRSGFPPVQRYSFSAPIGALAIDPRKTKVLYAGIGRPRWGKNGEGAVYRTADAGDHWSIANPGGGGMDRQAIVRDLEVDPSRTRRLYAATDRGLYRSDDAGTSWRQLSRGLPGASIGRVALCRDHPNVVYASILSPAGQTPWQGGVYRSDDGGETWTPRTAGLAQHIGSPGAPEPMTSNVDRIVVDPRNPEVVFAGDTSWVSAGVYKTADGGRSWKRVTDEPRSANWYGWILQWGPSVMGLAMDPRNPESVYFSTSGHLFRTTDGGAHWRQAYTRRADHPAGAPEVAAGWWQTSGLETTCLNDVAVDPADPRHLYACYFDIGLLQSFDGGKTFAQTVAGMRYSGNTFTIAFDPSIRRTLYAGTGEWGNNHGDVCRSVDGGLTWKVVGRPETGLPDGRTHHLLVVRGGPGAFRILVTVDGAGLFRSDDSGDSWQRSGAGLPARAIAGLSTDPGDSAAALALVTGDDGETAAIYRSDDRGDRWRRLGAALPCVDAKAMAVCPADPRRIYVAAREYATPDGKYYPGGVYASRDGGSTWARALDDPFVDALAVDPRDSQRLYAGCTDNPYHDDCPGSGVMETMDGGKTWRALNAGLTCRCVSCLTLDIRGTGRLYAGTAGNGVFVRDLQP